MTNEMKLIHKFPDGENVINMASHKDGLIICTNKGVYIMDDKDKVTPVLFDNATSMGDAWIKSHVDRGTFR